MARTFRGNLKRYFTVCDLADKCSGVEVDGGGDEGEAVPEPGKDLRSRSQGLGGLKKVGTAEGKVAVSNSSRYESRLEGLRGKVERLGEAVRGQEERAGELLRDWGQQGGEVEWRKIQVTPLGQSVNGYCGPQVTEKLRQLLGQFSFFADWAQVGSGQPVQ